MKSGMFVSLTVVLFCLLGGMYGPAIQPISAATSPQDELSSGLQSFTRVLNLVESNFADQVSLDRALYDGAIPGMLRTLDPHSSFLDPKTYQLMQQNQRGQYYGVGMEINIDGDYVVCTQPFVGSPAYKAGIHRGDLIVSVDDRNVRKMSTAEVADLLKGPRGTKVTVGIKREGADKKLSFLITRDEIVHSNVSTFWLKPGVAYVRLVDFSSQATGRDMEEGLKGLGEANLNGLVLDLRGNPGGLVSEAVTVAGHFLQKGQTVVSHRGRASAEQVFRVRNQNPNSRKYPLVVLVDKYSASASEIVAGALQDHDRAWILGESTFGKGLVQAQYPLSEGTALLLTIAKYHTPSGRLIQRDYEHRSFFDYYQHRDKDARNLQDVQKTDSGRTVYGGGGISPDDKYTAPSYSTFQIRILRPRWTFMHFANEQFAGREPSLPKDWKPDADTIAKFQAFLKKNDIAYTPDEFAKDRQWISDQIQIEMYSRAFDRKAADQLTAQVDAEVQKGIGSLPTAQGLLDEARRVIARRK
jgi:carboxyl-terminal processing protease